MGAEAAHQGRRGRGRRGAAAGLIALALLAALPAPGSAASRPLNPDARTELRGGIEPLIFPAGTSPIGSVASDGANSVNAEWEQHRGPGFYIEEQRHGEEAILDGLAHRSARLWRTGLREFTWGFAHQSRGGGFDGTQDAFHSTAFFVEGVAHTILVVRAGAAAGLSIPPSLVHSLQAAVPHLHAAARWMAQPAVWRAGLLGDAPYTHRRFLDAAAVGLTGKLTGDRALLRDARASLQLGLAAQLRNGVFPELSGDDSSYQMRGIVYAEQLLAWVPGSQSASLNRAITRGLHWELSRIRPSGQVVITGNTRANGVMTDHNGLKRVVYPMVARGLLWWGISHHDGRLLPVGRRVVAWGARHPSQVGRSPDAWHSR